MLAVEQSTSTRSSLGARIRRLRERRKLSLATVAERAGVSKSLVSQIERDIASPSIDTLRQLASALRVPTFSLLLEEDGGHKVIRRGQRRVVTYPGTKVVREVLSADLTGKMVLLWATFPPGESTPDQPGRHIGEESVVVIRGSIDVVIGGASTHLDAGDSMTFDPDVPHRFCNLSGEPTEIIVAISPPHI
jgi:transcriptional regulator with XRE-family HTH domain